MKAITYSEYGAPRDVLRLTEADTPTVAADGVLVRVAVAAVNPLDWHNITGLPYVTRIGRGLRRLRTRKVAGVDFAGVVEQVGAAVTRFRPGDRVFGMKTGAFAELVAVAETGAIAALPDSIDFPDAAALPVAAGTALQGLRDKGQLKPGQRVLINGAGGGVGTYAVQIAKALGAEVTAVGGTGSAAQAKALGADHVVDYTRDDFTTGSARYDVLFDVAGNRRWSEYTKVLKPNARLVVVGGPKTNRWLGPLTHLVAVRVASIPGRRTAVPFIANVDQPILQDLAALLSDGRIQSVIDRTYPLADAATAVDYVGQGHATGKVLLTP